MRFTRPLAATALVALVGTGIWVTQGRGGEAPGDGCPRPGGNSIVDWVPFLRFEGRTYYTRFGDDARRTATPTQQGPEVGRVTCRLSEHADPDRRTDTYPSGTAPFLDVGTAIHSMNGHPVACRVIVQGETELQIYVARHDVNGKLTDSC